MDYNWRTSIIAPAPAAAWTKALDANSRRVSVLVYSQQSIATVDRYYLANRPDIRNGWLSAMLPEFRQIPWRDFGPIIQDEVWLFCNAAVNTFALTEVFTIAN